jgi:SOS response associated peptidase (SRAP)
MAVQSVKGGICRPSFVHTTVLPAFGNWKEPASGEWIRTFAIITTDANELVANIHDRMPIILAPNDYARWLGEKPDPRDLMRPFPAELMRMWPISTRVNKPENDDPSIVEPIPLSTDPRLQPLDASGDKRDRLSEFYSCSQRPPRSLFSESKAEIFARSGPYRFCRSLNEMCRRPPRRRFQSAIVHPLRSLRLDT